MKIKDADHAVRVLESLVEQLKDAEWCQICMLLKFDKAQIHQECKGHFSRPPQTIEMLVEGAEAVLEDFEFWEKHYAHSGPVMRLAKIYATRMVETGMEVPE